MVTLDLAAHYSFFKFSRASTINSTSFLSAPFLEEISSISNLHLSLFSCEASPTFRNLTDILTDRQRVSSQEYRDRQGHIWTCRDMQVHSGTFRGEWGHAENTGGYTRI